MPYKTKSDLPESVKHVLPSHAQDIYKEAFNSAWDQYKDKEDRRDDASREETAHKVAWAAYCPVSGFKMSSKNVRKTPKSCRREACSGGGVR